VVICVFRDSLNYIHIARRVRGATKQRESIIRGMEIADGPTDHTVVCGYYRLVVSTARPSCYRRDCER
jgi:hypothetical protein